MERLETRRLLLRELRRTDVKSLHRLFSDPLVMRFWPPFELGDTEQLVERNLRRYAQDGFGPWALTLKGSDDAIGDCGMVHQEIEGSSETEIGWHLLHALWGQGLATEAAHAARDYAFDRLGVKRLVAIIHPDNVASQRVAEKIGMTLLKTIQHRDRPRLLYSLERPR
jgi:RimJ/RimL family protein N-acetyltransferase